MTRNKRTAKLEQDKATLIEDVDFLRPMVQAMVQEVLEALMTELLQAEKSERGEGRLGYRSGS